MARNGSGTYVPPTNSWSPAVNGTLATTADWQSLLNDIVAALTQSVSKDGQTVMTGSLDMGGFNLTNVASAAITALTGTPTAPTAAPGTNTTQIATTAHVFAERTNAATLTNKTLTAPVINSPTGIVKADVGLGNVDNTSDANKPVSTATQTALNGKQDLDADLTAIAGLASNGLIARTGAGTAAVRTLTAGAGVTITNGDGVAGNPTIGITPGVGTGDVIGPAGATDSSLAVFDGATGKLLKAGGSASHAGSLDFSGTARRITGDFSNATLANRLAFQTSTVNSNTNVGILPNGTAVQSLFRAYNNSDPTNSASMGLLVDGTQSQLITSTHGSGTALPMTFTVNGAERMRIDTSGNVLVTGSGVLGYGAGSGGTVTQATSKSTAVTLNKPSGLITMNGAALAANTTVSFTLNNTSITGKDLLVLQLAGGVASAASYNVWASSGALSATVYLRNITGGSLSEAANIQFVVVKGETT